MQRSGNPRYYAPEVAAGLPTAPPSVEDCLALYCREESIDADGSGAAWKCESECPPRRV